MKFPYPLSFKARQMILEQDIVNEDMARSKREKTSGRFSENEAYRDHYVIDD